MILMIADESRKCLLQAALKTTEEEAAVSIAAANEMSVDVR